MSLTKKQKLISESDYLAGEVVSEIKHEYVDGEVISHYTRKSDKQIKRLECMNIPTLKEYVMIEQDYVDICVLRKNQHWQPSHYFLGDDISFESIDLTLPVADIYHRLVNQDKTDWLAR
jgi:hypothetical protein